MTIQEEIKQSSFSNEYQKLLINQLFTGKWLVDIVSQHLKPYGLSLQQYNVLRILRGQESHAIGVNGITERMIDKMSNVSRLIDKLHAKKLLDRKVNNLDRRQLDIFISRAGLELLDKIGIKDEVLYSKLSNLSIEEAKQLNGLLDKLRN